MDYLSCLIKHLEKLNKIKGVITKDINLTHLLFIDDILLFVQDDDESIGNLQFAIHLFESASGLNINLTKTSISSIKVNKERTDKGEVPSQSKISSSNAPWKAITSRFPRLFALSRSKEGSIKDMRNERTKE
ncbi:LINE-1 retrotransposable element ORF2 protein [Cucumis melo var. makuwa]|uniref:LINE-1 retrotransposable element ORF2 protein n=1 Tax=Cucumis melo var. makuwa TaxID=1194695 RepID=A0A5A7U020_CUCMM|nr:LINE-1 retrotransposable element ORF2 protein [Cucumis melo var. makuwa]TYK10835.1 LINE-1 retrotransposable element ORF2 protein [Cucumis melo var. makuwa]